ncbi:MAG: hypothetical protein L3K26_18630, partial [Candidatus Hydrogenedentes bacterium]|nr:hypothetical protein [Candidatus Hydrogenedentota bacterium]
MNYTYLKRLRPILLAVLFLLGGLNTDALEAGVHATRLTLPEGTPLGGDGERLGRAALGEHDPLWVRCLYLNDGETSVYLVTLDLHHIPQALRARIVAMAEGVAAKESIFLTATHTGNGPGGMEERLPLRWADGRFQPTLLEYVAQSTLDAMRGAREVTQRATLGYGTARQQVLSVNAYVPDGPIDEQIGVIRVDNADGQALAIISNFSALPRMVPSAQRYYFSADYPGAYYTALEALSDPGCIAFFLPGAIGGQQTGDPEKQTGWAAIESIGRLLAVRTKSVANKMSFRDAKLKAFYREVSLPPTVSAAFCPTSTVLQALAIDDLVLVFLPGVPDVEIGLELRRQSLELGYANQFTVGVSNDFLMDVVPRGAFAIGTPASSRHHYGPGMASWLYARVIGMLRGVEVEDKAASDRPKEAASDSSGMKITLKGDGFERGYQRGMVYGERMKARYEER